MKTIKKVAVSTIPDTEGAVIDSFNTTDDKHTNAPSLNAVEIYSKANSDFAVITQNITSSSTKTVSIDYPAGYTVDNCVIISKSFTTISPTVTGIWIYSDEVLNRLSLYVVLENNNISAIFKNDSGESKTITAKIVLMKV